MHQRQLELLQPVIKDVERINNSLKCFLHNKITINDLHEDIDFGERLDQYLMEFKKKKFKKINIP